MGGGRWGECSGVRAARSLIFLKDAEGRNLDVLRAAGAQSRLYNQRRCCVGFCFSQIRAGRNLGRDAWARSRRALARSLAHSLTRSGRLDSLLEGAQLHLLGWVGGLSFYQRERKTTLFFLFLARHLTLSSASGAAGG